MELIDSFCSSRAAPSAARRRWLLPGSCANDSREFALADRSAKCWITVGWEEKQVFADGVDAPKLEQMGGEMMPIAAYSNTICSPTPKKAGDANKMLRVFRTL